MKKFLAISLSLLLAVALLSSCAASKNSAIDMAPSTSEYETGYGGGANATAYDSVAYDVAEADGGKYDEMQGAEYGQKIIHRAHLTIETLSFDESYSAVVAATKEFGGYVSNQYTSGGYYYSSDRYSTRYAELTLRIPADRYNEFLEKGSSFGNVTSVSDSSDDITSQYIDTEARLNSLKAQEERLLSMLDKAATLEELILLEDHLADVRYEIESYTSTLKTYENLTSYSTVSIRLSEVSTITNTSDTFGARIKAALAGSWRSLVAFLQNFAITIIYLFPYLIVCGSIFFIVRSAMRKRKAKRIAQYNAQYNANAPMAPIAPATPVAPVPPAVPQNKENNGTDSKDKK